MVMIIIISEMYYYPALHISVSPVTDLTNTMKRLYLREFRKHLTAVGLDEVLRHNDTVTVFAPHNKAFKHLTDQTRYEESENVFY